MPEEEPGEPTQGEPHTGAQEEPCPALRAHVLPAVPELLQVGARGALLALSKGKMWEDRL